MNPVKHPKFNAVYHAPEGMDPSQVQSIGAYEGKVEGGSLDGAKVIVVAWQPTPEEMTAIMCGAPILISFIGILPPHFPTVSFEEAIHPT